MNVVGLDMSVQSPGFASAEGTLTGKVPSKLSGAERLEFLRNMVQTYMRAHEGEFVVIESYFVNVRSASAIISLAELGGVVRCTLWRAGIPYVDVAPTRLKEFATGKGSADKGDMRLAAYKRANVEFTGKQEDECDAWWLRQMALVHYDLPGAVQLPAAQRDVLKHINWPVFES